MQTIRFSVILVLAAALFIGAGRVVGATVRGGRIVQEVGLEEGVAGVDVAGTVSG